MCGIIGYKGKDNATQIVLNGLKRLEYRGYDSFGIALKTNDIELFKSIGKVNTKITSQTSNLAIGHTRWATHGTVTEENTHPHLSNNKQIAVVHNGIVENHDELRNILKQEGFQFQSQTDTEIIPNLIEFYMRHNSFFDSLKLTLEKLKGSYALAIIYKNQLIAARKESPLVIGLSEDGYFVASDIPAFLDKTKQVMYLYDHDIVLIDNEVKIFNTEDNLWVNREINTIEWDIKQAMKGNFDHFLLKEISEQADIIKRTVEQNPQSIIEATDTIKKSKKICFVGCGTAYHACLAASYKFAKLSNINTSVYLASEFSNFIDFITPETLIIAVSQSGETTDVLSAIRLAKTRGAKILSITNVIGSTLARESDKTVLQLAGPEISVLSTKSYTSQLAILTLLSYTINNKLNEGQSKLKDLLLHIYYLTSANTRNYIKLLADKLRYANHIYIIGRGLQYPTALEAALKIKEVSYIHAEGYAGGELKHGSIALIEHGTPCIIFTSEDTELEVLSNAQELKARGAYLIGIGPKKNDIFDFFIKVRESKEINSICQIIPIQILAYQLALLRGCDPDFPRNLAKSVTVK